MKSFSSFLLIIFLLVFGQTPTAAQDSGPQKIPRIGLLASGASSNVAYQRHLRAFLQGLEELGYVDGKSLIIEYRYASGNVNLLPELAAVLVRANVSVIIPTGPTALAPLLEATQTVPIVVINAEPRWISSVKSYSKPGGNVTGLTSRAEGLAAKRLDVLKELFPAITRVVILDPPRKQRTIPDYERAAQPKGIDLKPIPVRDREEFPSVFAKIKTTRPDALITLRNTLTFGHARKIAQFSSDNRIPLLGDDRFFTESGGLVSFGVNYRASWRRAATFVDKILKGTDPAMIPIEPPQLELVINLNTATKIGVTIPPEILLEANEVIR